MRTDLKGRIIISLEIDLLNRVQIVAADELLYGRCCATIVVAFECRAS